MQEETAVPKITITDWCLAAIERIRETSSLSVEEAAEVAYKLWEGLPVDRRDSIDPAATVDAHIADQ